MESPNLHHQKQLQDLQLVGSSSSSSLDTEASCYGNQLWSPNVSLNSSNFNQGYTNQSNDSECINLQSHMQNNALIQQDLSLQWQQQQQNLTKLKELSSSSSSDLNDLSEKLLLKTISSGFPIMNDYCSNSSSRNFAAFPHKESFFSQIYPSINVSNLNSTSCSGSHSSTPRTFDMNLQTLDHHNSLMNSVSQEINLGVLYKGNMGFGLGADHYPLQQHHHHHQPSSCSPSDQFLIKMSQLGTSNNNEHSSETKRPSSLPLQGDARGTAGNATATASKKPRVEPRASCPPLKVRKEKLGDRIAALQQLVAPFGKTDTASVLMEAIGYIKFLQNQVETLSVPYMRSTRTRMAKASQGGSTAEEGNEEAKRDLRSRGLCLVPLSCMSYVTGESVVGGGFWPPPPGFGGGT